MAGEVRYTANTSTESQRVTWLELFYDLIFVTAFGELAKRLADDLTWSGFGVFLLMFLAVWWAWVGNTLFAARYGNGSRGYQWGTVAQLFTLGALALSVRGDLQDVGASFALAYGVNRLVLVAMYTATWFETRGEAPLARPFALGFGLAAALWLVSALVPEEAQLVFWGLALAIDLATPALARRAQARALPHEHHLPERVGLLQIIVLGSVVTEIVLGATKQDLDVGGQLPAILSLATTIALWRIYFDNASASPVLAARHQGHVGTLLAWLYSHLPLMLGLTTLAVGFGHGIAENQENAPAWERLLVCLSLAAVLWTLAFLRWTAASYWNRRHVDTAMVYNVLAGLALLFVWRGTDLDTNALAVIAALVTVVGAVIGYFDPASRRLAQKREALEAAGVDAP